MSLDNLLRDMWEEVQKEEQVSKTCLFRGYENMEEDSEEDESEDLSEQFEDLEKHYTARLNSLREVAESRHDTMLAYMKSYLKMKEEVEELEGKLERLRERMGEAD